MRVWWRVACGVWRVACGVHRARTLEQSEQAKLFEGAITEQRTARAEAASVGELRRRTAARAHGAKGHAKKAPKKRERGAEQK
jgi:hypothetical protein